MAQLDMLDAFLIWHFVVTKMIDYLVDRGEAFVLYKKVGTVS